MSTRSTTYLGPTGLTFIQAAVLMNTVIYGVKREGLGYTQVEDTPGNREFVYDKANGKISFESEFVEVEVNGRMVAEKIWILYKI